MKISFVDIQNFRKLKNCRVGFGDKEIVFVGPNNSGKTSAMDALIMFLKKSRRNLLSTTDFTLSNWIELEKIGSNWVTETDSTKLNLDLFSWQQYSPSIDVWLHVEKDEVHYVSHFIPSLDWTAGTLGIRLSFEPKSIEDFFKAYKQAFDAASSTEKKNKGKDALKLWPRTLRDFLDKNLQKFFEVKAYILDPSKISEPSPQQQIEGMEALGMDPFDGLFKIDVINAQRGFTDPNSQENAGNNRRLSAQLKNYFENHLNPSDMPDENDLGALSAIERARTAFDEKLRESFKTSISELEGLNYPGFNDPKIQISSKINPLDGLDHDASVQFNISGGEAGADSFHLNLPEQYNGLGYQNLISMIFKLIRYRDEWMRVGKIAKRLENDDQFIEPLHIVLIEEPEAHLHAQVQQVFVKKAYGVLRNHAQLGDQKKFTTQMAISTHSSHIAHEVDFANLRYFKRVQAEEKLGIPSAKVVNLSNTFGTDSETSKFAIRYLKTTHCDLFFADAAILVEGPAERMLVPHFIKAKFPGLHKGYISILEIGGSHAHRLQSLIENLGLLTLIITDVDSIGKDSSAKALPVKGQGLRTGNDTIKSWIPKRNGLDDALGIEDGEKLYKGFVRVAYQKEMNLSFAKSKVTAIPYTFEDALVLSNVDFFKKKDTSKGLIKKMHEAVTKDNIKECCQAMFDALDTGKKAEMALELLFITNPEDLEVPGYIFEGLDWLQNELKNKGRDFAIVKPVVKAKK